MVQLYDSRLWKEDIKLAATGFPDAAERLSGKVVMVTGATGLIGSAVIDILLALTEGMENPTKILAAGRDQEKMLKRFGPDASSARVLFVPYNATGHNELKFHADYIIHAASPATPAEIQSMPVETMLANLAGVKYLLEYTLHEQREGRHTRLLYVSSSEVYGEMEGNEPHVEEKTGAVDILDPRSAYPVSKRAAEALCRAYGEEYDTDAVIVRPGHIYGPGAAPSDTRIQAEFTRRAAVNVRLVMKTPGTQIRSYCYAADCASAILRVLLSGDKGEVYNISNRSSLITVRRMAEIVAVAGKVPLILPETEQNSSGKESTQMTEQEARSYSTMQNASLDSRKLESLGWQGRFDAASGFFHTVRILRGE